MIPSRLLSRAGLLAATAAGLACGSDASSPDSAGPKFIAVEEFEPAVFQGLTAPLTPIVIDSNNHVIRGARVELTALDPGLLTVDTNNVMHSVGALGPAHVLLAYGGIDTTLLIPVLERVGTFQVQPESLVLNRGLYENLTITLIGKSGAGYTVGGLVKVTSADTNIARALDIQIYGGHRSGQTTLTLAVDTFVRHVPVRVAQFPTSLTVSPAGFALAAGASKQLTVTVLDRAGQPIDSPPLAFVNESPALLTVSSAGKVTARGPSGSGTVLVTSDSLYARAGVLVGAARHFTLAHRTPIGSNAYEAAAGPNGAVVVTTDSAGQAIRGTLPAFTFPTTLATGAGPRGVVVNHAGTRAYVASGNELSVLDLVQNQVLPAIPVPGGGAKIAVEISPDDHWAFLSTATRLYKISLDQGTVADSMDLGSALALAMHPTAARLYAAPLEGDSIREIDVATMTLLRTFHGGVSLKEIGVSPDGGQLYAADETAQLVVFDIRSGLELQRVPLSTNGFGLAVSANLIAVATFDGVDLFDRGSRVLLQTIRLGGLPRRPAIGPNEGFIVVPNQGRWVDFIQ